MIFILLDTSISHTREAATVKQKTLLYFLLSGLISFAFLHITPAAESAFADTIEIDEIRCGESSCTEYIMGEDGELQPFDEKRLRKLTSAGGTGTIFCGYEYNETESAVVCTKIGNNTPNCVRYRQLSRSSMCVIERLKDVEGTEILAQEFSGNYMRAYLLVANAAAAGREIFCGSTDCLEVVGKKAFKSEAQHANGTSDTDSVSRVLDEILDNEVLDEHLSRPPLNAVVDITTDIKIENLSKEVSTYEVLDHPVNYETQLQPSGPIDIRMGHGSGGGAWEMRVNNNHW